MFSTINPPFIPEVLHELDRSASFAMCYGASLPSVQAAMDPDLHNPIAAELLALNEEQRDRRIGMNPVMTMPYGSGPNLVHAMDLAMRQSIIHPV